MNAVDGSDVSACYQAIVGLFEEHRHGRLSRGSVELANVRCGVEQGATCALPPDEYPQVPGRSEDWFEQMVEWWQATTRQDGVGYAFSHGERIRRRLGWYDQLDAAVKLLGSKPTSTRAAIVLVEPERDFESDKEFPSFCMIMPKIDNDLLHLTAVFRKQEMRYWWPINVAELARIQTEIAEAISRQTGRSVGLGRIVTFTKLAVYGDSPPRVAVPTLDVIADSSDGRDRLVAMAHAGIFGKAADDIGPSADWDMAIEQWAPPELSAPDGDPVSIAGTEMLTRYVRFFERTKGGSRVLGNHLEKLLEANRDLDRHQGDDDAFLRWKASVDGVLPKLRKLVKQRLKLSN